MTVLVTKSDTGRLDRSPFETDYLQSDLQARALRGGAATMAGQGAQFAVHTAATFILARLLAPTDFGLVAMVTAVTGFATLFKDLGLSLATVQKSEITHEQISTLFWINAAVSSFIAVVIACLGPVLAWFYREPRLAWITAAISVVFVLGGLAVQHQALLQRQMRFTALATIQFVATLGGLLAAVTGAALGARYWALIVMHVVSGGLIVLGVWLACNWRPGLYFQASSVRSMLGFGAHVTGFGVLNYFARNLDKVLIGKSWGADLVGLYSKAYALLMLPITQITAPISGVAIPALCRLQTNPAEYKRYYYRAINLIAFVTMPLMFILAALSREVVLIVLGEQWIGAASIFRILAFAAVTQPVINPVGWVYVSFGRPDKMLGWGMVSVPIIVLSFVLGLPWGPLGVATGYMLCSLTLLTFPCLWWAFRGTPLTIRGWLQSVQRPLILGLALFATIESANRVIAAESVLTRILLSGGLAALAFTFMTLLWPGLRRDFLRLLGIASLLLFRRPSSLSSTVAPLP